MQKKSYITPTLRIREVQLTLLNDVSTGDILWGDAKATRPYFDEYDEDMEYEDEYIYDYRKRKL